MRTLAAVLPFALLPLFAAGCTSKEEQLVSDSVTTIETLATTLEGVTDEASAKAAAPKVERLANEMKRLRDRQQETGEAAMETFMPKYGQRLGQATQRMLTAMMNLKPEAMKVLQPALDKADGLPGK